MSDTTCHRCNLAMEDDGEWFICPCCRCRTRGLERQRARHEQHMAELGMTEEEYDEHCKSMINTEPLSDEVLKGLQAWAQKQAEEWKPACPHDTVNPWAPAYDGSVGQTKGGT